MKVIKAEYIPPVKSGAVAPVGARPEAMKPKPVKADSFAGHLATQLALAAAAGFVVGAAITRRDDFEDDE